MKKALIPIGLVLLAVCGLGGLSMRALSQGKDKTAKPPATVKVSRGTLNVTIVETGTIAAAETVELKGLATGRLAKLLVEEGDTVKQGQLVAIVDPQQTQLLVDQNAAQLLGAQSATDKLGIQIAQGKLTSVAALDQARAHAHQLELQLASEPTLTKSAIVQADTALKSAIQDRERLVASVHPTLRMSTVSALHEAEANFENADAEYKRQQGLEIKGYVAGRSLDTAKLTYDLAKVRLVAAKDNLAKLDAQLNAEAAKADEQVRQAQAGLRVAQANAIQLQTMREDYKTALAEVAKADAGLRDPEVLGKERQQSQATIVQLRSVLRDAQRQLGETNIVSPITGVVTKKMLKVGELVTGLSQFSSGSTIVKLEDRRTMRVQLDINEIDVAKMAVGMRARIDVDAVPSHTFTGIVRKIAPASKDAAAGASTSSDSVVKYEVEIRLLDPIPQLRSGMSAKCSLDVVHRDNALLLPVEYVLKQDGKYYIDLAPSGGPNAKPERKEVSVGAASGTQMEILSGVSEGTSVVKPSYNGPKRKGAMQFGPDDQ